MWVPQTQLLKPLCLCLSLTQEHTVGCAWVQKRMLGEEPLLLTHVMSFEVPLTVTGLWEPNREGGQ